MATDQATQPSSKPRIRVFIDFWNFQITLNEKECQATGQEDARFKIQWHDFPGWLASRRGTLSIVSSLVFVGCVFS